MKTVPGPLFVIPMRDLLGGFVCCVLAMTPSARAQTGVFSLNGGSGSQTGQKYVATVADQSGVYVYDGGELSLGTPAVTKTGDASNSTISSERGVNSGVLAATGGKIAIAGGSVATTASSANGLFATGSGATIQMTGGKITTTGLASSGAEVTYGATMALTDVDVTTEQSASPALSMGFGGGAITANGGTFLTTGRLSPDIYSIGTASVSYATLTSRGGFGAVIIGANSIYLTSCSLTGLFGAVELEQTAASTGSATFTADGGSLTALAGDLFSVSASTGALTAAITLEGGVTANTSTGYLVNATSNSTVGFLADGETLAGNFSTDATSAITATLQNGTGLTGRINSGGKGRDILAIDGTSSWQVNGPSILIGLTNAGTVSFIQDGLTVDVTGGYSQTATGALRIVLGGTTAGTNYDQLAVAGVATFAGTLIVDEASGFTPQVGETFNILTYGSKSGTFAKLTSNSGLTYTIRYGGTEATITIVATSTSSRAPTIMSQPTSVRAHPGASVTFTVVGEGLGVLSYQWYEDGRAIAGAMNASYTIPDVNAADAASYDVMITNSYGSVTSAPAPLKIKATTAAIPVVTLAVQGDGKIVEGGEHGVVLISRTGDVTGALTVDYQLKGSAVNGEDYVGPNGAALPGTAVIPAGAASVKVKFVATGGSKAAPVEKVKVLLASSPAGDYSLGAVIAAKLKLLEE